MFRFTANKKNDNYFELSKETLNHIKVARVTNENFYCRYEDEFYLCKLDGDKALIIEKTDIDHEHKGRVAIAASIINIKRFEWMIQKLTELGVTDLYPVISKNVSQKIDKIEKKYERWETIVQNATEQSFRNKEMIIHPLINLEDVLKLDFKNKYIAHEQTEKKDSELFESESIFLVGPEGGFTDEEVKEANENGFSIVNLGNRILRAETASLVLASRIK